MLRDRNLVTAEPLFPKKIRAEPVQPDTPPTRNSLARIVLGFEAICVVDRLMAWQIQSASPSNRSHFRAVFMDGGLSPSVQSPKISVRALSGFMPPETRRWNSC